MKTDLRVIKTKKAIRQAFSELLCQKTIDEITVSDIASKALINRKTFYAHYAGIFEIISEIEDEIVSNFEEIFSQTKFEDILNNPSALFQKLTDIINSDIDLYGNLVKMNRNSNLTNKIIQDLRFRTIDTFENQISIDKQTLDLTVYFIFSGLLAVFSEWFNSDRQEPLEELSAKLRCLCFDGVNGIVTNCNNVIVTK